MRFSSGHSRDAENKREAIIYTLLGISLAGALIGVFAVKIKSFCFFKFFQSLFKFFSNLFKRSKPNKNQNQQLQKTSFFIKNKNAVSNTKTFLALQKTILSFNKIKSKHSFLKETYFYFETNVNA